MLFPRSSSAIGEGRFFVTFSDLFVRNYILKGIRHILGRPHDYEETNKERKEVFEGARLQSRGYHSEREGLQKSRCICAGSFGLYRQANPISNRSRQAKYEFTSSYWRLPKRQQPKGYTMIAGKTHAAEVYLMESVERDRFFSEVAIAAKAINTVFKPI